MILQSYPIIIPVDCGDSAPLTEKDIKVLISALIIVNVLSVLLYLIGFIINNMNNKKYQKYTTYNPNDWSDRTWWIGIVLILTIITNIIALICYLADKLSNYI